MCGVFLYKTFFPFFFLVLVPSALANRDKRREMKKNTLQQIKPENFEAKVWKRLGEKKKHLYIKNCQHFSLAIK
jgi:hypothetical protein